MREKEFLPLIKEKLNISDLNPMQEKMLRAGSEASEIILLAPTGSGKTLAFIMPMLKMLKPSTGRVQTVILAPSRELVIQIAGIIREIARGFKVTVLYGGHKVEDEVNSLSAGTDIIVSTPGRMLDHIERRNIDVLPTRILILDEYDKMLELGFEKEMKKIIERLKNVSRTILTSATPAAEYPDYLNLKDPVIVNFTGNEYELKSRIHVHKVESDGKDKLNTLRVLLNDRLAHGENELERQIIFVNHRESAERVADYLKKEGFPVELYHGQLDQLQREKAIAKFNNGSTPILVATDLAARGLDISNVKSVIHYHQALTPEVFKHRNGRTARVDREGDVYILVGPEEEVKPYVEIDDTYYPDYDAPATRGSVMETVYFSVGKKEKISKGDILGFLTKECEVPGTSIGKIDVFDHYALAAVQKDAAEEILKKGRGKKIKREKPLISII